LAECLDCVLRQGVTGSASINIAKNLQMLSLLSLVLETTETLRDYVNSKSAAEVKKRKSQSEAFTNVSIKATELISDILMRVDRLSAYEKADEVKLAKIIREGRAACQMPGGKGRNKAPDQQKTYTGKIEREGSIPSWKKLMDNNARLKARLEDVGLNTAADALDAKAEAKAQSAPAGGAGAATAVSNPFFVGVHGGAGCVHKKPSSGTGYNKL